MTDISSELLLTVAPLYVFVLLGVILGKVLKMGSDSMAVLMFYVLFPLTVFEGARTVEFSYALFTMPLITWVLAVIMCITFVKLGHVVWQKGDGRPALLGLMSGTANCGYFGLPVAMALFDANTTALYITLFTGLTIFESSVGYYTVMRGQSSAQESLLKVAKLPSLYAFFIGVTVNGMALEMPPFHDAMNDHIRGAYVFCGMLMVGLGLSRVDSLKVDIPFILMALGATFVAWPLLVQGVIFLDQAFLQWFNPAIYQGLILLSIVPLAANSVAIACLLNTHPEKVATAVLLSTLIALFYVPFMAQWLLGPAASW